METFYGHEILSSVSISVGVSENNFSERSSTAWVMNNFLYDSFYVSNRGLSDGKSYPSLSL